MTNKVKPFFIRITDNMTPQMVQDAFNKCVDAGANVGDCVSGITQKYEYESSYTINTFKFFGVTDSHVLNSTRFYMKEIDFGKTAKEITLDQLDEWLGLEVEEEWKNGDRVTIKNPEGFGTWDEAERYLGTNGTVMAVFTNTNGKKVAAVSHDDSVCICWMLSMLSKPETPEQKAERERFEAAYDLYAHVQSVRGQLSCKFDWFSNSEMEETRLRFLAIVDKTGYRKQ